MTYAYDVMNRLAAISFGRVQAQAPPTSGVVHADEARLGERLRHDDGKGAVSAPDVGDSGAALQALDDTVKLTLWLPNLILG